MRNPIEVLRKGPNTNGIASKIIIKADIGAKILCQKTKIKTMVINTTEEMSQKYCLIRLIKGFLKILCEEVDVVTVVFVSSIAG